MDYPITQAVPLSSLKEDPDIPVYPATVMGAAPSILTKDHSDDAVPPKVMSDIDIQALRDQGFPIGLARVMTANNSAFPLRIWVVEDRKSVV